jgi:hypothetical protein
MISTDDRFDTMYDEPATADARPGATILCTAETAECACPDFCERDHDND